MRYSEAFKVGAVRELEREGLSFAEQRSKYGLGEATMQNWVRKYGNGSRGKVIRVEKPDEIDQRKQLQERVRVLERTIGTLHVELALERAYMEIACKRAGISDVGAFKKKPMGSRARGGNGGWEAGWGDGAGRMR